MLPLSLSGRPPGPLISARFFDRCAAGRLLPSNSAAGYSRGSSCRACQLRAPATQVAVVADN